LFGDSRLEDSNSIRQIFHFRDHPLEICFFELHDRLTRCPTRIGKQSRHEGAADQRVQIKSQQPGATFLLKQKGLIATYKGIREICAWDFA
jgi:hypothetical protein